MLSLTKQFNSLKYIQLQNFMRSFYISSWFWYEMDIKFCLYVKIPCSVVMVVILWLKIISYFILQCFGQPSVCSSSASYKFMNEGSLLRNSLHRIRCFFSFSLEEYSSGNFVVGGRQVTSPTIEEKSRIIVGWMKFLHF